MAKNPIFSYTNRDIESARSEGMSRIPMLSGNTWTDLNATDPGMVILDYVHALVDMVQYYQDHNALEAFLSTAKERKNIFRLAKQMSYNIRSAKGSTVDLKFYLEGTYTDTIRIPKNTIASTSNGIEFLTKEDAYIPAGENYVIVPSVQGEFGTEYYKGTGISRYSNTIDSADQRYTLAQKNIDIDSIEIIDESNNIWQSVEYLIFADPQEKVYQKILNYDGSITIAFGNGERGAIPEVGSELTINYIYSLAEEGSTGAGTIIKVEEKKVHDMKGNLIDIKVTNEESTAGGSSVQSDESIKEEAPGIIKSQDRAVTLRDYENLAKSIDGVKDAKAYDINNAPEGVYIPYYNVKVVIIPELNTAVNSSLTSAVYDYISKRMIPPTTLEILKPSETYIDITTTIVKNPDILDSGLEYTVRETIMRYFNDNAGLLGTDFVPEELKGIINKITGVRYISEFTPEDTVTISTLSIMKLGNLNIIIQ